MSLEVEGHFKNFYIRSPGEDELPKMKEFLIKHYHHDEPIGKRVAFIDKPSSVETMDGGMTEKIRKSLHLCLIAIETKTREISGVLLNYTWCKTEADAEWAYIQKKEATKDLKQWVDENGVRWTRLASKPGHLYGRVKEALFKPMFKDKYGVFECNSVSEVVWTYALATSGDCRGQGLASDMMLRFVDLLRKEGKECGIGYFTNSVSRRVAEKVGFEEVTRSYFKDAVDERVDGAKFFPDANDSEDFVALMMLQV